MRKRWLLLFAVLGLLVTVQALAAPQLFTEHTIKDNWIPGRDVYATDLDGDGDTDVLGAAAMGSDDIIWWENDGSMPPSFTEHLIDGNFYDAGEVYATDLDGDGHMDVLAVSGWDGDLTWWQNTGVTPPTFTKHTIEGDFHGGNGVYAVDLDNDGDTDVLGSTSWSLQLAWWENNPSDNPADPITWTEHAIKSGYSQAATVHATDVDGDDDTDVLTVWAVADEVSWFENDGGTPPTFSEHVIDDDLDYPNSVYAADLDSDGDTDVLAAATNADSVTWWENDGSMPPSFTEHTVGRDLGNPMGVYATDVDGDGDSDVLSAMADAGRLTWWENDHSGNPADPISWTEHIIKSGWYGANRVHAVDVDGDGDVDVLGTTYDQGEIAWWENRTNDIPAGRIAFASRRDGNVEVYTMNSDGSDVRRLTYNPGADGGPAWSPDGTEIVFSRGYGSDCTEVWVMDANGQSSRRIAGPYDRVAEPRWSPDGSQILFRLGGGTNAHLYVMPSDESGPPVQVTDMCGGEIGGDWAPDGRTIIFHADPVTCSYDTEDTYLHLMNLDDHTWWPLLDHEGNRIYGSYARYSPDGVLIAFERYRRDPGGADSDIYVVNSDGSNLRQFLVGPYDDGFPVWSPDGQALAFLSSNRGTTYSDVWVARLDDPDNPIQLTTHPASDMAWDWWGLVDTSPPTTLITIDGSVGNNDWFISPVVVTVSATDEPGGLGVAYTEYSLDDGATWNAYSDPFTIADEGITTMLARSADNAGNLEEPPASVEVKIDLTAPSVTITQLTPNPANVLESPELVAEVSDRASGVESAWWCAGEPPSCTWQLMYLEGEPGDLARMASTSISGLSPGVYSISVRGQDVAGNWSAPVEAFLVVYDPDAGFATGGGWIIPGAQSSETDDFLPGITGEDKANFGFAVKYKKGATTPDGQLEFHYRVGDFNLHSTDMHWMVINDNWAKLQGYATINLHPDELFHFRVDARDGRLNDGNQPDKFVLKIWYDYQDPDLDDPVYKASGDLAGGNIIIHAK